LRANSSSSHSKLGSDKAWYDAYPREALQTDKNNSINSENGERMDSGKGGVIPFHKLLKRIMSQSCSEEQQYDDGDGRGDYYYNYGGL
jgi:hypothetical protein